ncbi:DUF6932 family protein [Promicromonospora sp. NPDC060204]|uniref:DUF6932 family protein n=1 Tax=Promicromonospora sp. NPDC060204 TaxID=3347071 RepID=UPI003665D918
MVPLDPQLGCLPYRGDGQASAYSVSVEEMRAQFAVNGLRTRQMDRFEAWLEDLSHVEIEGRVWVGGSFVTDKEEPSDVDVVLLCDPHESGMLTRAKRNPSLWTWQDVAVSDPAPMVISRIQPYGGAVDAFFALAMPHHVATWENRWNTCYVDEKPTDRRKGFLEVTR